MKIQFIGTGSGKTSLKRNHSSILISSSDHNFLIDAGEGISKALLSQHIDHNLINSILFTHYHADHFAGIASLITQMKLSKRKLPLSIYTHEKLIDAIKVYLNTCYLFDEKLGFDLNIFGFEEETQINVSDQIKFTAKKNSHIKKSEILNNYNHINFISCSFCINVENNNIVYTSDIGSEIDLYLFKEIKAEYFITETTHVSLEEIYKYYKTCTPKRLLLTHIDDESEYEISRFISKLSPPELNDIFMIFDGFVVYD